MRFIFERGENKMNSDQLQYLIEISKNPSINIASQKLHITSQALSTAIKKLESELGFSLLNRTFKGISLTEDGQWLVQKSTQFLVDIENRKQQHDANQSQRHQGTLEILINYSGINDNILGRLVCTLYQKEPDLNIELKETQKEHILNAIKNHSTEFGFVFRTKVNGVYVDTIDDDLIFEPIFHGDFVLLTNSNSELAKFNSITLKKTVQYPICSYNPLITQQDTLYHFLTNWFKLPVHYTIESHYAVYKEKIQRGLANALSIFFLTEPQPNNYIENCKIIHFRDDIRIYCGLVKNKTTDLSENARFFIQSLKELTTVSLQSTNKD